MKPHQVRQINMAYLRLLLLAALIVLGASHAFSQDSGESSMDIKQYIESSLPPQEGRIIDYNEGTGILTVTDTPSNQQLITKLVKQFDIGPKQVMIEARLVEVKFNDLNEYGIEWNWLVNGTANRRGLNGTEIQGVQNDSAGTEGIRWGNSSTDIFPQTTNGIDFFISKTTIDGNYLRAYLHALQQTNKGNLLSSPKIATLAGQMANIQITRTIPYVSKVAVNNIGTADHPIWQVNYTVDERLTGITLEVTPYVGEGGDIISLDIHPEVSTLNSQVSIFRSTTLGTTAVVPEDMGWPVVDTRTTQTSVMVKSGETIIMGGLVSDSDSTQKKKVPILGDIPIIGVLFSYTYTDRTKKNLLIFLTATIIDSEGMPIKAQGL